MICKRSDERGWLNGSVRDVRHFLVWLRLFFNRVLSVFICSILFNNDCVTQHFHGDEENGRVDSKIEGDLLNDNNNKIVSKSPD